MLDGTIGVLPNANGSTRKENKMSRELDAARELVKMLEEKENAQKVKLSTLRPGETFKIGEHVFIVLKQEKGQTKVISKEEMARHVQFDDSSRDYNVSNLKKLIENTIQPIIEALVGAENVIEHTVDLTSVDMQSEFCAVTCKVRPITFDEAREFNDLLVNEKLHGNWWTLTPWSTEKRGWEYSLAAVRPKGEFGVFGCDRCNSVRPLCILNSNIFVSRE